MNPASPVISELNPDTSMASAADEYENLSEPEFRRAMEEELFGPTGLAGLQREREILAEESPLIKVPPVYYDSDTSAAARAQIEKEMYHHVLGKLNQRVNSLMEEQRFQRTLQKSIIFAASASNPLGPLAGGFEPGRLTPSSSANSGLASGASTPRNGLNSRKSEPERSGEPDEVDDLNSLLMEMMQPVNHDSEMDTPNASVMNGSHS